MFEKFYERILDDPYEAADLFKDGFPFLRETFREMTSERSLKEDKLIMPVDLVPFLGRIMIDRHTGITPKILCFYAGLHSLTDHEEFFYQKQIVQANMFDSAINLNEVDALISLITSEKDLKQKGGYEEQLARVDKEGIRRSESLRYNLETLREIVLPKKLGPWGRRKRLANQIEKHEAILVDLLKDYIHTNHQFGRLPEKLFTPGYTSQTRVAYHVN